LIDKTMEMTINTTKQWTVALAVYGEDGIEDGKSL